MPQGEPHHPPSSIHLSEGPLQPHSHPGQKLGPYPCPYIQSQAHPSLPLPTGNCLIDILPGYLISNMPCAQVNSWFPSKPGSLPIVLSGVNDTITHLDACAQRVNDSLASVWAFFFYCGGGGSSFSFDILLCFASGKIHLQEIVALNIEFDMF